MNIMSTTFQAGFASAVGVALLSACGGGGGSGGTLAAGDTGTLKVAMTDAPACGFDKVNVTVSKIRVHKSGSASENDSGWSEITLSPAKKIDLLTLQNGIMTELGQTALPAGRYTQIRLVLTENGAGSLANSVVRTGSATEVAIDTPSAIQSGIKLNNEFEITANTTTELVLDFDACKSIVTKGNGGYLLKPVIGVIPKMTSGSITGHISGATSGTLVSVQQNGVVVKSTVPDSTGAFTLSPVPASTSYVVVISSSGKTTAAVTGVPVTAGSSTALSTSTAPIALTASATATVSGTALPLTALATVRATQSLTATGPVIEVGSQAADSVTGNYSLTLPTAAPLLGKFGTLPIAFSAAETAAAAGKYTIEASATGFARQTADVDIKAAGATKNFTLTP